MVLFTHFKARWLLCCLVTWNLHAADRNFYPVYDGTPPLYSKTGFLREDRIRATAEGATDYNLPLYFEPKWNDGAPKIGVLIVHGYGAGPLQNLEIQKWWAEQGIASYALRLAGHGVDLATLKRSNYEDWQASVEGPLNFLKSRCDTVFVYGLSTGAPLAFVLAAKYPEIQGLMLQAPMIKSSDDRYYYFSPIVRVLDLLGIDSGQVYIDGDGTSMHYWIPYCIFRGVYQVSRGADRALRDMPSVHIPVMIMSSPVDTVADPESADIIAKRSHAPWVRAYWFGHEHTPLISPNMTIYTETIGFMSAALRGEVMNPFQPTRSILVTDWPRTERITVPDTIHSEWRSDSGLYGRWGWWKKTEWEGQYGGVISVGPDSSQIGIGVWQDQRDNKVLPSSGAFHGVALMSDLSIRPDFRWYQPIFWQTPLLMEWNGHSLKLGCRTPMFSKIQDQVVTAPEFSLENGRINVGINLMVFQGLLITTQFQPESSQWRWGVSL